jgi:hypothetical protein
VFPKVREHKEGKRKEGREKEGKGGDGWRKIESDC